MVKATHHSGISQTTTYGYSGIVDKVESTATFFASGFLCRQSKQDTRISLTTANHGLIEPGIYSLLLTATRFCPNFLVSPEGRIAVPVQAFQFGQASGVGDQIGGGCIELNPGSQANKREHIQPGTEPSGRGGG